VTVCVCDDAGGVPLVSGIPQAEINRLGLNERSVREGSHGFGLEAEAAWCPTTAYQPAWEEVNFMDISGAGTIGSA